MDSSSPGDARYGLCTVMCPVCPGAGTSSGRRKGHIVWHLILAVLRPEASMLPKLDQSEARTKPRLALASFSNRINTASSPQTSSSFLSSSYLPCLGVRDQKGGSPQIGPCIAQRGGTVCSTAFGSLTGVFFGTLHSWNPFHQSLSHRLELGEGVILYLVVSVAVFVPVRDVHQAPRSRMLSLGLHFTPATVHQHQAPPMPPV